MIKKSHKKAYRKVRRGFKVELFMGMEGASAGGLMSRVVELGFSGLHNEVGLL